MIETRRTKAYSLKASCDVSMKSLLYIYVVCTSGPVQAKTCISFPMQIGVLLLLYQQSILSSGFQPGRREPSLEGREVASWNGQALETSRNALVAMR